jgi:hypothetical protein
MQKAIKNRISCARMNKNTKMYSILYIGRYVPNIGQINQFPEFYIVLIICFITPTKHHWHISCFKTGTLKMNFEINTEDVRTC